MNASISSQLRPFVVGFAICAANVALAQIEYSDAPVHRTDDAVFDDASYESELPRSKALVPQPSPLHATTSAVAGNDRSNAFGTDPQLASELTALLPLFSNSAKNRGVSAIAQRETFDAAPLANQNTVAALKSSFNGNSEKIRLVTSSALEVADR